MSCVEAVVFDMDGLIFDTEVIYKRAVEAAGEETGYCLEESFYQRFIGVAGPAFEALLWQRYGRDFPMDFFQQRVASHYQLIRAREGIKLKQGFARLHDFLLTRQIPFALATSSTRGGVEENFSQTDYLASFQTVITRHDISQPKPYPDCYLAASAELGVHPEKTWVFEDSNPGMRAAIDAGCNAVMVPDLLPPEPGVAAGAYGIIDSLDDAVPLLLNQV